MGIVLTESGAQIIDINSGLPGLRESQVGSASCSTPDVVKPILTEASFNGADVPVNF